MITSDTINNFFSNVREWVSLHKAGVIILTSLLIIASLIHFFGWWETLGILFLKFGLGAKVAGAKTLGHAVIKAGGKKAIITATSGMLAKRHIIDIFSKFFATHSISRYKQNLLNVLKLKLYEIRNSSPVKKIRAFGSMLLSIPMIYFFWTKVLGTAIQKIVYALVVPLFTLIWNMLITSFNIVTFIFQVLMLNVFLDALANYKIGKIIIKLIDSFIYFIGSLFKLLDKVLNYFGINPKAWLIKLSIKFNGWLETILDKDSNVIEKVQNRRDRYINIVETISEKRYQYLKKKKIKHVSFWKQSKIIFSQRVLKKKSWQEVREKRKSRLLERKYNSNIALRKRNLLKRRERKALLLPYSSFLTSS